LIIRATALAALVSSAALAVPAVPREVLADVGRDTLSAVSWPLQLDTPSTYILAFAAQGTAALLREDIRLYRRAQRVHWNFRRRSVFNYTLHMGHGLFDLGVMAAFAFGDERARRTSITGIEALTSVAVTSILLKRLFRVPRPESNGSRKDYFSSFRDDAFPSGHTMSAFATAAVISAEYPSAAPLAYTLASLVGLSVMKRGWHWPSDVLAGAALGLLIGRASVSINRRRWTFAPSLGGLSLAAEI
jgi:membrane-associated phospholipid phosphatase